MKHQYHFGRPRYAELKEVARVSALIRDLDRIVRILESDIATEEERAGVSDSFNANYPTLARILTARRDNLKDTIVALERRVFSRTNKVELT
jgi:hypothetical protein